MKKRNLRKTHYRHCERSEAIQNAWIYPFGARKLRKLITATPLLAARDDGHRK
jgi:hypothetical protein